MLRLASAVLLLLVVGLPTTNTIAASLTDSTRIVGGVGSDQVGRLFSSTPHAPSSQPTTVSYWGMNLYMSKGDRVRTGDNVSQMIDMAIDAGVQWTREEMAWDVVEPRSNKFVPVYDKHMRVAASKGLGVIGMLLTTPEWARDPTCRPTREAYWCPPADPQEFAKFAAWMVERYDGDGYKDAIGSPRVAAWEIWNEPNDVGNWPDIGADSSARKRRYGEMLVAAYKAIKDADPSAIVLVGGEYVFDGGCNHNLCDGINFLGGRDGAFQQVPAARKAFDVFSSHPYASPTPPDAPWLPGKVLIEGTSRATRAWLNSPSVGRPDAPIWITELGWCTAPGACPGAIPVTEEQQANYLIRALVIAQQNGVRHTSWFQFDDAFNDPNRMWSQGAIVRDYDGTGYPPKPAYFAYHTLANTLRDAAVVDPGPVNTHVYDPRRLYTNTGGTYDYRYQRGATIIDVLWRPTDRFQVAFPVVRGKPVTLVEPDGKQTPLTPIRGQVQLTLSERPLILVQGEAAAPSA